MIQRQRFRHFSADFQRPGVGFQATGVSGRVGLIQPKFIEVVITGDFIFRRQVKLRLVLRRPREIERRTGGRFRPVVSFKPGEHIRVGCGGQRERCGSDTQGFEHLTALHKESRLGGDIGFG